MCPVACSGQAATLISQYIKELSAMPFETTGLNTQQVARLFIQRGGPSPTYPLKYYGTDAQYMFLQGVSKSYGGINGLYLPSASRTGTYDLIQRTRDAPDLPEATLQVYQRIGTIPYDLGEQGCPTNLYLVIGACGNDLADPINGWDGYTEIYSLALAESNDGGDRMAPDSDDALMDEYALKPAAIYKVGALSFGDTASSAIDREVVDVAYGGGASCGTCGPADDGTRRLYAVTKSSGAGSPGIPANVIYVERNPITGTTTVREYDITGLGATTDPVFIDVMGPYLIVGVSSSNSYYYATLDSVTGAPGTWTQVTTGFVATKTPNDIWVRSANEAYICGNGGYVYRLTDVTTGVSVVSAGSATTNNLNRIHGAGTTIVAVGASGTVVRSLTTGDTWATTTSTAGAAALVGVWVFTPSYFQIVNTSGVVYTTDVGGASYTSRTIGGATAAYDIVYATPEVGYIVYTDSVGARLQATTYGGVKWYDSVTENSRIKSFPSFGRANRIAVPRTSGPTLAANTIAIAGVATTAANADGALYTGTVPFL